MDLSENLTALSEIPKVITSGLTARKVKKWQEKLFFPTLLSPSNTKQSAKIEFTKILFNDPGVWCERMFHNL